jgi:hypothetical protein
LRGGLGPAVGMLDSSELTGPNPGAPLGGARR